MKCEVRECSASASIASRSGRRPLAYGHHPLLVLGRAAHDRAQSGNSRTRRHRATTPASVYSWHDDAVGQLRCLRLGLWRRYRRIANDVAMMPEIVSHPLVVASMDNTMRTRKIRRSIRAGSRRAANTSSMANGYPPTVRVLDYSGASINANP